jgi:hypothetical protein
MKKMRMKAADIGKGGDLIWSTRDGKMDRQKLVLPEIQRVCFSLFNTTNDFLDTSTSQQ